MAEWICVVAESRSDSLIKLTSRSSARRLLLENELNELEKKLELELELEKNLGLELMTTGGGDVITLED